MTVKDLIALLKDIDPKTYIVINGEVIQGIKLLDGRVKDGYYNHTFVTTQKSVNRDKALVFTRLVELTDGELVMSVT